MSAVIRTDDIGSVVERASSGDVTAFARIVAAHQDDMVRVAFIISGDTELAHDAVQSAWIVAWRKLRTVRDPDRVRAWLMAVAVNETRQALRRAGRRRVIEIAMDQRDVEEPSDRRADPSQDIPAMDLGRALQRLDPEDRMFVAMRYGAGMNSMEIGAAVGMTGGGVRARLGRILAVLRKDLADV